MIKIITKEEAQKLGLKRYYTGQRCIRGHLCERQTSNGCCIKCDHESCAKQRKSKPEYHSQRKIKWAKNNPDKIKKAKNKWYKKAKNNNPEKFREQGRIRARKRRKEKPDHCRKIDRIAEQNSAKKPEGKLRIICKRISKDLRLGKLPKTKRYYLDYNAQQFEEHLLENLPQFNSVDQAHKAGYHIDHIVPISYIAKNVDDKFIAFKMIMDLSNLRLLKDIKNKRKNARIDLPEVQELIPILWKKYGLEVPAKF